MRKRYPFDALHWLRHDRVERRAVVVNERAAETEQARREEARAEAARRSVEKHIEQVGGAERARLEQGELRAADLQVSGEWRQGAALALERRSDAELRARTSRIERAAAEHEARRALGEASNDARVVDGHRTAFRTAEAAAEERSAEEDANEQWTASRFPARSGR